MREDPKPPDSRNEKLGPHLKKLVHVLGFFHAWEFKRCLMMNPLLICTNGYMHGEF